MFGLQSNLSISKQVKCDGVCFLLGNSPASEFYMPTFRNTLFKLHRRVGTYPPMKMELTGCSETSAYKIQPPENYPEENIQHSEQGESLKLRKSAVSFIFKVLQVSSPVSSLIAK